MQENVMQYREQEKAQPHRLCGKNLVQAKTDFQYPEFFVRAVTEGLVRFCKDEGGLSFVARAQCRVQDDEVV